MGRQYVQWGSVHIVADDNMYRTTICTVTNPLENYSEEDIFNRFRFRLPTIMYIMNTIEHSINHNSKKNCALPPVLQLLTCLRFLATGAFHRLVGDSIGISETTTGRCCRSVCDAIISNLLANTITFPKDNLARHTKQQFLKVAGIKKINLLLWIFFQFRLRCTFYHQNKITAKYYTWWPCFKN